MVLTGKWGQARMLLLLVLWIAAGKAAARPQAEPNDSPDPASVLSRIMRTRGKAAENQRPTQSVITQQLWRNRVLAPEPADDAQGQIDLNESVRRIRSVRFERKEQQPPTASPFVMPEPIKKRLDAAPDQETTATQVTQPTVTPSAALEGPLPPETAETLKRVIADPNQASDPLELAELLYLTGRFPEAAVLYRKALDGATSKGTGARADRAWILLQLGNCLRDTDPAQAKDMYAKLVAEHADCPWVDLAKAHSQLIAWYEQVQPRQWIAGQEAPPTRQVAASQRSQP